MLWKHIFEIGQGLLTTVTSSIFSGSFNSSDTAGFSSFTFAVVSDLDSASLLSAETLGTVSASFTMLVGLTFSTDMVKFLKEDLKNEKQLSIEFNLSEK